MILSETTLSLLLKAATSAPSGDNAQPWKFIIEEDAVVLINVPDADTSPFNHAQTSNYIALGAALENMRVIAGKDGYDTLIEFFPSGIQDAVARMKFSKGIAQDTTLTNAVFERTSNRKVYSEKELTEEALQAFSSLATNNIQLSFVTEEEQVKKVGALMSGGELVTLENKDIHQFLFSHVTWTPEDDAQRHGFYIKTFEFKPPQEAAFKLFKNWRILRMFHPLGITKMIARDMAGVYGSSAAFGAISMKAPTSEDFVRAGMIFERAWLTATHLGIAMQVTASIPLLSVALARGGATGLAQKHVELVGERTKALKDLFSISQEDDLVMAWRLGYADAPQARTSRAEPVIERV